VYKNYLFTGGDDGVVNVWDISQESNKLVHTLDHGEAIRKIAFFRDEEGTRLAVAGADSLIKVWNLGLDSTGTITSEPTITLTGRNSVAFSPDGEYLAAPTSNNEVKIWDKEGKEVRTLRGHTRTVYDIVFSPGGGRLATGSGDHTIKIWNADSGDELTTLHGHADSVFATAFSPDSRYLITAGQDKTIKIWSIFGELATECVCGVRQVAFDSKGDRLAAASGRTITLWNVTSNELLPTLSDSTQVYSLAFDPNDPNYLATAGEDGTVKIWDLISRTVILTLTGHTTSATNYVAYSPDGKHLAAASEDKTAVIWDIESGQQVAQLEGHTDALEGVIFSPDGKFLATASDDETARLWTIEGQPAFTFTNHTNGLRDLAFSPDGTKLATAGDTTARVWDVQNGQPIITFTSHTDWVYGVAFNRDGTRLATTGADKTIRIWNIKSEPYVTQFILTGHSGAIRSVAFDPNNQYLASGSDDRTVRLYPLQLEKLLEVAQEQVTRSLTPEECQRFFDSGTCPVKEKYPPKPINPFANFVNNCDQRSIADDREVEVTFVNVSNNPLGIYWLDYEGEEKYAFTLEPNNSKELITSVTHSWCIRDLNDGHITDDFVITEETKVVEIQ
jgi:WD40 repeat protein